MVGCNRSLAWHGIVLMYSCLGNSPFYKKIDKKNLSNVHHTGEPIKLSNTRSADDDLIESQGQCSANTNTSLENTEQIQGQDSNEDILSIVTSGKYNYL